MSTHRAAEDLFVQVGRKPLVDAATPEPLSGGSVTSPQTSGRRITTTVDDQSGSSRQQPVLGYVDPGLPTIRYTISTVPNNNAAFNRPDATAQESHANDGQQKKAHTRRLSGKLATSAASPISSLASRLKRVIRQNHGSPSVGTMAERSTDPTSSLNDRLPVAQIQASAPLEPPQTKFIKGDERHLHASQNTTILPASGTDTANLDGYLKVSSDQSERPLRTGSSDSVQLSAHRPHPPPSFPVKFYDRVHGSDDCDAPSVATSQNTPSRSSSARSRTKRYTISSMTNTGERPEPFSVILPPSRPDTGNSLPRALSASDSSFPAPHNAQDQLTHRPELRDRNSSHMRSQSESPSKPSRPSRGSLPHYNSPFHSTIHHYTTCSHVSPPASRPLNEQPRIETLSVGASQTQLITRSMISGSCFDCDTSFRRHQETQILLHYNAEVDKLEREIEILRSGLIDHVSPTTIIADRPWTPIDQGSKLVPDTKNCLTRPDLGLAAAFETPTRLDSLEMAKQTMQSVVIDDSNGFGRPPLAEAISPSIQAADDLSALSISQIHFIRARIQSLHTQRDAEVQQIWRGYSARWGPGTLGVMRKDMTGSAGNSINGSKHNRNVSRSTSLRSYQSDGGANPAGSNGTSVKNVSPQRAGYGHGFAPSTPARSVAVSTVNSSGRRGHTRGTSRDSTFSSASTMSRGTGVTYESSLDTPEGRMRIDWVRQ